MIRRLNAHEPRRYAQTDPGSVAVGAARMTLR